MAMGGASWCDGEMGCGYGCGLVCGVVGDGG